MHISRSNVLFGESDYYAILRLKHSKTDIYHSGVQIMLIVTGEETCPIVVLRNLFMLDSLPANATLFRLAFRSFLRQVVIRVLKKRLVQVSIKGTEFSRHSFQKDTSKWALNKDILNKNI